MALLFSFILNDKDVCDIIFIEYKKGRTRDGETVKFDICNFRKW